MSQYDINPQILSFLEQYKDRHLEIIDKNVIKGIFSRSPSKKRREDSKRSEQSPKKRMSSGQHLDKKILFAQCLKVFRGDFSREPQPSTLLRKLTLKFDLPSDQDDITNKSSFEDMSHLALRRKRLESVKVPANKRVTLEESYIEEKISDTSSPKYMKQDTFSNHELVKRNTTLNSKKSRQVAQLDPKKEGSSGGSKINISQINVFQSEKQGKQPFAELTKKQIVAANDFTSSIISRGLSTKKTCTSGGGKGDDTVGNRPSKKVSIIENDEDYELDPSPQFYRGGGHREQTYPEDGFKIKELPRVNSSSLQISSTDDLDHQRAQNQRRQQQNYSVTESESQSFSDSQSIESSQRSSSERQNNLRHKVSMIEEEEEEISDDTRRVNQH